MLPRSSTLQCHNSQYWHRGYPTHLSFRRANCAPPRHRQWMGPSQWPRSCTAACLQHYTTGNTTSCKASCKRHTTNSTDCPYMHTKCMARLWFSSSMLQQNMQSSRQLCCMGMSTSHSHSLAALVPKWGMLAGGLPRTAHHAAPQKQNFQSTNSCAYRCSHWRWHKARSSRHIAGSFLGT
jgi:hypothetical protein